MGSWVHVPTSGGDASHQQQCYRRRGGETLNSSLREMFMSVRLVVSKALTVAIAGDRP
jgi:hypothetical protein